MNILIAVAMFFLIAFSSVVWAIYIKGVAEASRLKAAIADAVLHLIGGLTILACVVDWRYLIVVVLASFVGTYWKVGHDKKKERIIVRVLREQYEDYHKAMRGDVQDL